MRQTLTLITLAALSACGAEPPTNCAVARKKVYACIDRITKAGRPSSDNIFDVCVPMADPRRFRGTWAKDFEFNEFHEGQKIKAEDAWQHHEPTTRLWGDALEQYTSDEMAYVIEIEFVGRRPVCNFTEPVRDIVVDDLIRTDIIERSPSKM